MAINYIQQNEDKESEQRFEPRSKLTKWYSLPPCGAEGLLEKVPGHKCHSKFYQDV